MQQEVNQTEVLTNSNGESSSDMLPAPSKQRHTQTNECTTEATETIRKHSNTLHLEEITFADSDDDGVLEDGEKEVQMNDEMLKTSLSEEENKLLASKLDLEHEWVFWYDDRLSKGMSLDAYENTLKSLGKFATVQDFWRYWNLLTKVDPFPEGTNLRLFKGGIKPMWEDPSNEKGGKWVIHTHKASTYQIWSKLVLAVVGEQFEYGDSLCGVVLSVRPRGDSIQIWNSTADDTVAIEKTTTQLKSLIGYQAAAGSKENGKEQGKEGAANNKEHVKREHHSNNMNSNHRRMHSNGRSSSFHAEGSNGTPNGVSNGRASPRPENDHSPRYSHSRNNSEDRGYHGNGTNGKTRNSNGNSNGYSKGIPDVKETTEAAVDNNENRNLNTEEKEATTEDSKLTNNVNNNINNNDSDNTVKGDSESSAKPSPLPKKKGWGDRIELGSSDESGASDKEKEPAAHKKVRRKWTEIQIGSPQENSAEQKVKRALPQRSYSTSAAYSIQSSADDTSSQKNERSNSKFREKFSASVDLPRRNHSRKASEDYGKRPRRNNSDQNVPEVTKLKNPQPQAIDRGRHKKSLSVEHTTSPVKSTAKKPTDPEDNFWLKRTQTLQKSRASTSAPDVSSPVAVESNATPTNQLVINEVEPSLLGTSSSNSNESLSNSKATEAVPNSSSVPVPEPPSPSNEASVTSLDDKKEPLPTETSISLKSSVSEDFTEDTKEPLSHVDDSITEDSTSTEEKREEPLGSHHIQPVEQDRGEGEDPYSHVEQTIGVPAEEPAHSSEEEATRIQETKKRPTRRSSSKAPKVTQNNNTSAAKSKRNKARRQNNKVQSSKERATDNAFTFGDPVVIILLAVFILVFICVYLYQQRVI